MYINEREKNMKVAIKKLSVEMPVKNCTSAACLRQTGRWEVSDGSYA